MTTLPISEVFGPTVQGEGPSAGQMARFIRFGYCNLSCSWCDTAYTWDPERYDLDAEIDEWDVSDLLATVDAPLVVLTGGEPMLQARKDGFRTLVVELRLHGTRIEIETNGTIPPPDWLAITDTARFTVSPKLSNAEQTRPLRPIALDRYATLATTGQAVFKFVATSPADLDEAARIVADFDIPAHAVWIMPEGTTPDTLLARARDLADPVLARGWNLTSRMHVLLWGDERGR